MYEAYRIGVTLTLNNLVTPQLLKLSEDLTKLDIKVLALSKSLKAVGMESAGLKSVASASQATARALELASSRAAILEKRLGALRTAGNVPSLIPTPGGGNGGGARGGGRSHGGAEGGRMHMGANGVGLGAISYGLGAEAMLPLAIASGGVYAAKGGYEAAKDFQTEVARLTVMGLDRAQVEASVAYVEGLKTWGTSKTQNMRFFTEAQGVFRESGMSGTEALAGAKLALPVLSKIYAATSALDDETAAKMRTSSLAMLRFDEMKGGLKSPEEFNRIANAGWKAIRSSGGNIDWEQYRQFLAKGGVAAQGLSDSAFYGRFEPLIGELKGGGAGDALMTSFNRLTGGVKIPNQIAHSLVDLGIWDKSKVAFNNHGGIKRISGNPLKDFELYSSDPTKWYEKYMMPAYDKDHLSPAERARQNTLIFGRTGGKLFSLIDRQLPVLKMSETAYGQALGISESLEEAKKTGAGAEGEFVAAWADFKKEFGRTILPQVTSMLVSGAGVLRELNGFMAQNKGAIDTIATFAKWTNPLTAPGEILDVVKPQKKDEKEIHTTVQIDGRTVATAVTPHLEKDAARATRSGGTRADPGLSLVPPMMHYQP